MVAPSGYARFIAGKHAVAPPAGFDVPESALPASLFPWQKAVVRWALRMGRSALFLDTGLGKTRQALAWADAVAARAGRPVLILTPLAVGPQFVTEAARAGVPGVGLWSESSGDRIHVANYQKLHRIDAGKYAGVVPDESSILKSYSGKVVAEMTAAFAGTPYKLCCTATPSPNDVDELGNHAAFLGVRTRAEMLATYFTHDSSDTGKWRLKGHAEEAFWKWVATWAMVMRHPSDIGFDAPVGYDLPPLEIVEHFVGSPAQGGRLFPVPAATIAEHRSARSLTRADRVGAVADLVNGDAKQWLVWCERNDEGDALAKAIRGAVQVAGADADEDKVERMTGFGTGRHRVLVSKPSICGFGMNWQHCDRMAFVGLSHSFEQFYQAVRRCWRFGQTKPVTAHVVTSDLEAGILDNVRRKQSAHDALFAGMLRYTAAVNRSDVAPPARAGRGANPKRVGAAMALPPFLLTDTGIEMTTVTDQASGDGWAVYNGDCVECLSALPGDSVHFTLFSPPYMGLYVYSDSPRDMGNCRTDAEFHEHFGFVVRDLLRVTKPGRIVAVDCMNVPAMKERDGYIGIKDFRGELIRRFVAAGFIFHSEVCMWKDPLVEATRTKSLGLMHKQLCKDSAMSRMGLAQYILAFRKPGENREPVHHPDGLTDFFGEDPPTTGNLSHERWRRYASPVWMDVDFTRTLNYHAARDGRDERHICPMSLDAIHRCLQLWSNPGEIVLSPFAGIGSEGFEAVKLGRRFLGFELKESYFDLAVKNLTRAEEEAGRRDLFSDCDPDARPARAGEAEAVA